MRYDNIDMLQDTLQICERGYYKLYGERVPLRLSKAEMKHTIVWLPDEVHAIDTIQNPVENQVRRRLSFSCENTDSFTLARKRYQEFFELFYGNGENRILVLNLANPVNPGGGVRRGARAQEEDLCRKSSLLLSLEGSEAHRYYAYNRTLHTYMGSDAVMITPNVEIIKDENGDLLVEPVTVSVMTCAAPMLRRGNVPSGNDHKEAPQGDTLMTGYDMEDMSDEEYQNMVSDRIDGMLRVAAHLGYRVLVLGAFGCGAFHNDARVVSDLFAKAIRKFSLAGFSAEQLFDRIDFAVLATSERGQYNYQEFARNFEDDSLKRYPNIQPNEYDVMSMSAVYGPPKYYKASPRERLGGLIKKLFKD